MNLFFIRTRLQCLIAQKIIREIVPKEPYAVIFLYQRKRDEDAEEVYVLYDQLRTNAVRSCDVVGAYGIGRNLILILPMMFWATISGGRCFLSVVNSLPIALAAWLLRWARIETFDDGAANILPNSHYYHYGPMQGKGLKKALARILFPHGSTAWIRNQSRKHYTIFNGHPNIVASERVIALTWDWAELLDGADLAQLDSKNIQTVVLGTPHNEFLDPEASRHMARLLIEGADLYIFHPREDAWIVNPKARRLSSPAEAILIYLGQFRKIKIYHFNSTVGYSLGCDERFDIYNLLDPETLELKFDYRR